MSKRKYSRSRSRDRRKDKKREKSRDRRSSDRKYKERRSYSRDRRHKSPVEPSENSHAPRQQRGKYYVPPPVDPATIVKQLPCFQPSGILLQYYNSRDGVALKFHEPPEAKIPTDNWRIYPFKDGEPLPPILLIKQSCFLLGKDDRICDILLQNPSISRQHAVIQFRQIKSMNLNSYSQVTKPYIMDLESSNGTLLNGKKIPTSRYVEILTGDTLKFGTSNRQYVVLKEEVS